MFIINSKNGNLTQNMHSHNLIVKSKYNQEYRIKSLLLYYKPLSLVLLISKNKFEKKISIGLEYPDIKEKAKDSFLCDLKSKSNQANVEANLDKFNFLSEKCVDWAKLDDLYYDDVYSGINKRKCKFENLINFLENSNLFFNLNFDESNSNLLNSQETLSEGYKEVSLLYNNNLTSLNLIKKKSNSLEDSMIIFQQDLAAEHQHNNKKLNENSNSNNNINNSNNRIINNNANNLVNKSSKFINVNSNSNLNSSAASSLSSVLSLNKITSKVNLRQSDLYTESAALRLIFIPTLHPLLLLLRFVAQYYFV